MKDPTGYVQFVADVDNFSQSIGRRVAVKDHHVGFLYRYLVPDLVAKRIGDGSHSWSQVTHPARLQFLHDVHACYPRYKVPTLVEDKAATCGLFSLHHLQPVRP